MKQHILRPFIAGSSFLVVVWPFLYLGVSKIFNPEADLVFELVALEIPLFVGVLNIIFVAIRKYLPFGSYGNYWAFGALHGVIFSFIGNFVADIPMNLFLLSGSIQFATIPAAIILYALIWRYAIRNLNIMLGLEA